MTPDESVQTVRAFARTVTERVGALSDSYLSRDRPLGAARVLWEIGPSGAEVSEIRGRLNLDSGYLSRILRGLESERLIDLEPSALDGRSRRVQLTTRGRDERAVLDAHSDDFARSVVAPLTEREQEQLLSAMATVTTLLTAAAVEFVVVDPETDAAQFCLREYFDEINGRFETGFDPADALPTEPDSMRAPRGLFVVATLHGKPVGCGALKFHAGGLAEVKRVWISPDVRGFGLGRRMLGALEMHAAEHGASVIHLDSNAALTEAIALYRASGYEEVAPFNDEPYAHFWFEKRLG
jgi:DNA-binding MarR family transcriptional regulator/GNAT superfamily N-acetyltransferase